MALWNFLVAEFDKLVAWINTIINWLTSNQN